MNSVKVGIVVACSAVCASLRAIEYVVPDYERWPAFADIHTQVSNALALCKSGDVVTVKAGTYTLPDAAVTAFGAEKVGAWMPPNFYSGGATLRGDPAAGREGVIIRGGSTYAVVYARNRALRLEGLTFEDCANARSRAVEGYQDNAKAWAAFVVSNCVFRGTTPRGGTGVRYATVVDCVFTNCSASSGGAASNCRLFDSTFAGNEATSYGGAAAGCSVVSNCTFASNAVSDYDGGALSACGTVVGCYFERNFAARWGGALYDCKDVRDCTFGLGNAIGGEVSQSAGPVGAACGFTRCTFTGDQGNESGAYTACVFTNMTTSPITCRTNGRVALTNCLFAASDSPYNTFTFIRGGQLADKPCTLVNCTFADNALRDAVLLDIKYGEVKNCLFFGNTRTSGGKIVRDDVSVRVAAGGDFTMRNCAYGVDAGGLATADGGNFAVATPCFAKGRVAGAPYWSLRASLRNRQVRTGGLVEDWMAVATDLAGLPRLRGGRVGIGCYECWLDEAGGLLLIR